MRHIMTYSGLSVDPLNLSIDDIVSVDIGHALSMLCRFNGHCDTFYSVAEHSLLVASLVPKEYELRALLHDASEAYLSDVTSPVKWRLDGYKEAENAAQGVIEEAFGLAPATEQVHDIVKHADRRALATEKRDLMHEGGKGWEFIEGIEPAPNRIRGLLSKDAKRAFLVKLTELLWRECL